VAWRLRYADEDFRLDEHVAVVTGAGRGIGAGTAMAYAQAGADVVLVARTRPQLDAVAARVRASGRKAVTVAGDVRDLTQVPVVVERAVAELGRLDVVVNNAGGAAPGALLDTPAPTWMRRSTSTSPRRSSWSSRQPRSCWRAATAAW
jgi:7-alpha-hydroxysteroid dehydrogenase